MFYEVFCSAIDGAGDAVASEGTSPLGMYIRVFLSSLDVSVPGQSHFPRPGTAFLGVEIEVHLHLQHNRNRLAVQRSRLIFPLQYRL
jgi:hypothetical protein